MRMSKADQAGALWRICSSNPSISSPAYRIGLPSRSLQTAATLGPLNTSAVEVECFSFVVVRWQCDDGCFGNVSHVHGRDARGSKRHGIDAGLGQWVF